MASPSFVAETRTIVRLPCYLRACTQRQMAGDAFVTVPAECGQTSDDVITFFYVGYVSPNSLDDACAFMAQMVGS